uniref:Uncharacterized protein n=1 Tax=Romanomermis culicivorax TaxID=13658 RepID=A0A915JUV1_ROMCU
MGAKVRRAPKLDDSLTLVGAYNVGRQIEMGATARWAPKTKLNPLRNRVLIIDSSGFVWKKIRFSGSGSKKMWFSGSGSKHLGGYPRICIPRPSLQTAMEERQKLDVKLLIWRKKCDLYLFEG